MNDTNPAPRRRAANRTLGCVVALGALVAATVVAPSAGFGASAKATPVSFVGYSGGTLVRAANNTVTSALTASSELNTIYSPLAATNKAASATVASLVTAGAVTTSVHTQTIAGGYRVVSSATTTGLNALGGAITASAIEATSTTSVIRGKVTAVTATKFVGLTVAGNAIPATVPPNYIVTIPGVATVALNYAQSAVQGKTGLAIGMGLYVSLLQPRGANGVGAELAISPTYAAIAPIKVPASRVTTSAARAYGTSVTAKVGSLAEVHSDRTAPIAIGAFGTNSVTRETSAAAITLSQAVRAGAIRSTAMGTDTKTRFTAQTSNKVAGVNLLGGAIRATALTAHAKVTGVPKSGRATVSGSAKIAGLVIGGRSIPVNAKANTTIKLGSLATVVINQQLRTASAIIVRGLVITLSTGAYGLPAGAQIQIAVASAGA